jgi:hypothetical protein
LLVLARGYKPAAWYMSGQMLLFSVVLTMVLVNWGKLDWPFVMAAGLQIGVAGELVVFAIALSSRVRRLHHQSSRLETRAASLAQQARTDPLTGLLNRSGLALRAQELLERPEGHALMLLDLDRFKPVNDIHGHAAEATPWLAWAATSSSSSLPTSPAAQRWRSAHSGFSPPCAGPSTLAPARWWASTAAWAWPWRRRTDTPWKNC